MEYDPLLLSRRRAAVLATGVSEAETRGDLWDRGLRGVLRPAWVRHDETTTRVGDAVALMSTHNALGGWAALRSAGNAWFDGRGPDGGRLPVLLHCLPGSQLRRRAGIRPSESLVHPDELVDLGGYRTTTMARAAFDEMCGARSVRDAVVVADMATSTTSEVAHTTRPAIARVIGSHHKVRGIVRARRALDLSSTRSASPLETRTRLAAVLDADLTNLSVNTPLFDGRGTLLGIADLLDEESGLVIETDGVSAHGSAEALPDYTRHEGFERQGLVVCRVMAEHLRDRWGLASRLRLAQRDALRRRAGGWTTDKPGWWSSWRHATRWD